MIKILFVCHGNICRSPMAEFVMKQMVKKAGLEDEFYIESAATSTEEIGNDMYSPAKAKLREKGVPFTCRAARQMTRQDYHRFDMLVGMDEANRRNILRICGGDPEQKVCLLLDRTDTPRAVADPWYTDDFEATWQDVIKGCSSILKQIENKKRAVL